MDHAISPTDLMKQGRDLALGGRLDEAEGIFRDVLQRVRGRGDAPESSACGNLGSLYGVMGRPYEAILLYRRGLEISRLQGEAMLVVKHLANIASMFVELGLWEEAAHVLAESEGTLQGLPESRRDEAASLSLWAHAHLASHLGQVERARVLLDRFREATRDRDDVPARSALLGLEAGLLRKEGQAEKALQLLENVDAEADGPSLDGLFVQSLRVSTLEDLGREDEARDEAERFLDVLEADVAAHGAGELSIDLTMDIGRCLAKDPGRHAGAQRAYDLAASIVMARIAALDACTRVVPELSILSEVDRAWLAELRSAYQKQQRTLLRHVAVLLKDASNGDASILHARGPHVSIVRICAWCSRVGTREGNWLPLAHYVPNDADLLVTHCICTDCRIDGSHYA